MFFLFFFRSFYRSFFKYFQVIKIRTLIIIFAASYLEGVSSIRNLRTRHAVGTRNPNNVGTITENIKMSAIESLSYYELKQHKQWLHEVCSELLDRREQAKQQCLQDPSQINGDNLNSIKSEGSWHFRTKKREM
jgi:hypothetical protein